MGFFGELLGTMALGALNTAINSALDPSQHMKFDVCFESDEDKKTFFSLLDKWNEIFQRKNFLVDPQIEKTDVDDLLGEIPEISTEGVAKRWWENRYKPEFSIDDWMHHCKWDSHSTWKKKSKSTQRDGRFSTNGLKYTTEKGTLIEFHNNGQELCGLHDSGYDLVEDFMSYTPYGIWYKTNNGLELGFIFQIDWCNNYPDGICFVYFKNKEKCLQSSAILAVVGPSDLQKDWDNWNDSKHTFYESELGLERLLTILNRHDVFENMTNFLAQPYTISEKRKQELAEQKQKEAEQKQKVIELQKQRELKAFTEIEKVKKANDLERTKKEQQAAEAEAERKRIEKEKQDALLDDFSNL